MVCPPPAPLHGRPARHSRPPGDRAWLAPSMLLLAVVLTACGGATGEQRPADAPESATAEDPSDGRFDATGATPSESVSQCRDGSCFDCGAGLCPTGFYCDEGAVGGAACSWLPSCPKEPSCACVTRELGQGCSCEERGGGVYVSCS